MDILLDRWARQLALGYNATDGAEPAGGMIRSRHTLRALVMARAARRILIAKNVCTAAEWAAALQSEIDLLDTALAQSLDAS